MHLGQAQPHSQNSHWASDLDANSNLFVITAQKAVLGRTVRSSQGSQSIVID